MPRAKKFSGSSARSEGDIPRPKATEPRMNITSPIMARMSLSVEKALKRLQNPP
jgi:hypothetical protein